MPRVIGTKEPSHYKLLSQQDWSLLLAPKKKMDRSGSRHRLYFILRLFIESHQLYPPGSSRRSLLNFLLGRPLFLAQIFLTKFNQPSPPKL